jgi:hypothetical protein
MTAIKFLRVASTAITAILFFVTGVANLVPLDHIAKDMSLLGYPPYFHKIIGTWKIIGALVIVLPLKKPFLKEWAYCGIMLDLTGAAASRMFIGHGVVSMIVPLIFLCVATISWYYNSTNFPILR